MSPRIGLMLVAIVLAASLTTMIGITAQSAYAAPGGGATVTEQKCQSPGPTPFASGTCHVVRTPSGNTNVQGHSHPP
jgi:hypothetical protein